jgi:hypothetical protein
MVAVDFAFSISISDLWASFYGFPVLKFAGRREYMHLTVHQAFAKNDKAGTSFNSFFGRTMPQIWCSFHF